MTFQDNEYFENVSLQYTAIIKDDEDSCKEVIGETINWKEGKDVTKKKIKKTQKNKKTGQKRVFYKTVPQESIFNLFESRKEPENMADSDDEDSEEERLLQGLQDAHEFSQDVYDMYMGEALEHYLYPDTTDLAAMLNAQGGAGDDDDDDDEDDDDKDSKKSKKSKGSSDAPAPGAKGEGDQKECK